MTRPLLTTLAWLAAFAVAAVFIGAAVVTASDAQGAFVYILALPVCGVLLAVGHGLSPARSVVRTVVRIEALFLVLFLAGVVIPPLQFFPRAVTGAVAGAFERLAGASPYAWARQRGPAGQLAQALNAPGGEITLAQMSIFPGWTRICVFGPGSTEEDAARTLGYYSATLAQSRVGHSDAVAALVFTNDRGTLGVVDVERSVADFAELSKSCLTPGDFPLRRTGPVVQKP